MMIFNWFRKSRKQDPEHEQLMQDAFDLGVRAVESVSAEIDDYIEHRFGPLLAECREILKSNLEEALNPTDLPPLIAAASHILIFNEDVSEASEKITQDVTEAMREWIEVLGDIEPGVPDIISVKVNAFIEELVDARDKIMADYSDRLRDADVLWRQANPEISAQIDEELKT